MVTWKFIDKFSQSQSMPHQLGATLLLRYYYNLKVVLNIKVFIKVMVIL
jgi:hypothetical protein